MDSAPAPDRECLPGEMAKVTENYPPESTRPETEQSLSDEGESQASQAGQEDTR